VTTSFCYDCRRCDESRSECISRSSLESNEDEQTTLNSLALTKGSFNRIVSVLLAAALSCSLPAFAALRTNDDAPAFSLPTVDGTEFDLGLFFGQGRDRPSGGVVLSFFATWCRPCRNELPLLNALVDDLKARDVAVVVVDLKEDLPVIRRFISGLGTDKLIVLSDRDGNTAERFQVRFLPMTFCIGADGKIKDMIYGEVRSADEFLKCAAKLFP
jgi:cytochrome c biogenesis protein CcmG/thiol:disulfide interchange protein DsbE